MGSEQNRFPQQERQKRWSGCLGGFSCFGTSKGGKRIVPSSRIPEGNASAAQPNGPQAVGLTNQATSLAPSLLAPPSSPASFSNSALPSTAQSPSCFLSLSANSPGGPSSAMFATGPYAHETQLVSPPVFSTFTTEPSTAPFTPPPELAHLTTPSSPDVPYARFLSSTVEHKNTEKTNYISANDVQISYSPYPGSPASSLRSPVSRASGDCLSSSFPERDFPLDWDRSTSPLNAKYSRSGSGRIFGLGTAATMASQDTNFFCPATFAQYYLDNPPFPHAGGRLSVSKESDSHSTVGNGQQSRHNKNGKQEVEEIEAYRASFGFSADEIQTTSHYVEISDDLDDSFTMTPFPSTKPFVEDDAEPALANRGPKQQETQPNLLNQKFKSEPVQVNGSICCEVPPTSNELKDHELQKQPGDDASERSLPGKHIQKDEEELIARMGAYSVSRKYHLGSSSSDAEIDYRRGRSKREGRRI